MTVSWKDHARSAERIKAKFIRSSLIASFRSISPFPHPFWGSDKSIAIVQFIFNTEWKHSQSEFFFRLWHVKIVAKKRYPLKSWASILYNNCFFNWNFECRIKISVWSWGTVSLAHAKAFMPMQHIYTAILVNMKETKMKITKCNIGKIDMNGVCELCATLHAHITWLPIESQPFYCFIFHKWNIITQKQKRGTKQSKLSRINSTKRNVIKSKNPKHIKIDSIKMRLRAIFRAKRERKSEV